MALTQNVFCVQSDHLLLSHAVCQVHMIGNLCIFLILTLTLTLTLACRSHGVIRTSEQRAVTVSRINVCKKIHLYLVTRFTDTVYNRYLSKWFVLFFNFGVFLDFAFVLQFYGNTTYLHGFFLSLCFNFGCIYISVCIFIVFSLIVTHPTHL